MYFQTCFIVVFILFGCKGTAFFSIMQVFCKKSDLPEGERVQATYNEGNEDADNRAAEDVERVVNAQVHATIAVNQGVNGEDDGVENGQVMAQRGGINAYEPVLDKEKTSGDGPTVGRVGGRKTVVPACVTVHEME